MNNTLAIIMIISIFLNLDNVISASVSLLKLTHKRIELSIISNKITSKYLEQNDKFSNIQSNDINFQHSIFPFVMDLAEYQNYKGKINESTRY